MPATEIGALKFAVSSFMVPTIETLTFDFAGTVTETDADWLNVFEVVCDLPAVVEMLKL